MFKILSKILPESNRFERIWKIAQVDFRSRYYNNKLGVLWALLFPLFRISLYYTVFNLLRDSTPPNFAIFIFAGLLIWLMFAESTKRGITLINRRKYLIQNIQFNHFDLFTAHILGIVLGFNYNIVAFFIFSLLSGVYLGSNSLYFPIIFVTLLLFCYSISIILATLNGFFKDIKHLWDLLILAGFWGSAIFYEADKILEKAPRFAFCNPFLGIIMNTRRCLLFNEKPDFILLNFNLLVAIILTIFATFFFKKYSYLILEKL